MYMYIVCSNHFDGDHKVRKIFRTHPMEGHENSEGVEESQMPRPLKESMQGKWVEIKSLSGGKWILSQPMHCMATGLKFLFL